LNLENNIIDLEEANEIKQLRALYANLPNPLPSKELTHAILSKAWDESIKLKKQARKGRFVLLVKALSVITPIFLVILFTQSDLFQKEELVAPNSYEYPYSFNAAKSFYGFNSQASGLVADVLEVGLPTMADHDQQKVQETARREFDADFLLMRGRRFKALGRMDLALVDFETLMNLYPDYTYMGDVLMYRAQCYAFLGNYPKAVESMEIYANYFPSKRSLVEPMIEQLKIQAESPNGLSTP